MMTSERKLHGAAIAKIRKSKRRLRPAPSLTMPGLPEYQVPNR